MLLGRISLPRRFIIANLAKFASRSRYLATMTQDAQAVLERSTAKDLDINSPRDPNTLSNYNNFRTFHTAVNFAVDFKKKLLSGNVVLSLKSMTEAETNEIVLDTSYLSIEDVKVNGTPLKWSLAARLEPYGSALTVKLDKPVPRDETVTIDISLSTTDKCTALQWLTPAQTSNKKHPYMFSQCQAIHARSLFPCQDTPDVKSAFMFKIDSSLPVVASGLPNGNKQALGNGLTRYEFKQDVPIPAYLFAIASGDIVSASVGPRSTVWTGPGELEACKWEFEGDTETFIKSAEKIVYDYAWGTYNILVLPPSFPYGGMENPIYTFATPTIVSGDKQNVDVIAHELAHSWSGNLVSNASWEHFWLNEGWTTYLERRIGAAVHGESQRDFSAIIGWKGLVDSVERYGHDHEFTKLITDLKGKDPDDAFSQIPYEKGFTFLYYLEKLIGKNKFDDFIPHYFTKFKYKSLDSYEFKATLLEFFKSDDDASKLLDNVDWDTWFYKPGLPPKPDFDTSMVDVCYKLAEKWESLSSAPSGYDSSFEPSRDDIDGWSGNQVVVFLETVQNFKTPLKPEDVETMGHTYGLFGSQNVEIVSRFFTVGLLAKDKAVYQPTADLLGKVGRMKFVRTLFRQLKNVDADLAVKTFEKNKDFYHPICRAMVEKDLFG